MSNIQITENRLGKYSPEWFYNESQTSEWTAFTHKADELRKFYKSIWYRTVKVFFWQRFVNIFILQ